ncbi:MAG: GAF domain-containing sensor histidine kinase [Acidimicrobiia bacterium]
MPTIAPSLIRDLVEAAASVAAQVELTPLLRSTVRTGMELTGAKYGALGVLGEHGALMDFVHIGLDPGVARGIGHLPRATGLLGTITRMGATVRIDDISKHDDAVGFPEGHPAMMSFIGVPVRVGERVFGNLYLTDKDGGFTDDDEVIVEFLAVTAGTAVSTLRMQERLRRAALHEDRERIARDLHDSIIQDLFAVGLGLQASMVKIDNDPAAVHDQLDSAIDKLDETISSLRRYIFDLRPPVWARPSLSSELSQLLEELVAPHPVAAGLDFDCPSDVLDAPIADDLFAVIKESVSNALRHGKPTTVDVRVVCEGETVRATISDDGIGFDTDIESEGLGLDNMAERVERALGSLFIDSAKGRGTVVHVAFPMKPPEEDVRV